MHEPALDIGCGVLNPLRWSDLCVVYRYDHFNNVSVVEDKTYTMHIVTVTTAGEWEYRGKKARGVVAPGTTVLGNRSEHFGCHHVPGPDSNLVAALRPTALDDGMPNPFGNEILNVNVEPLIRAAIGKPGDAEFESAVFEMFDVLAGYSNGEKVRSYGALRMQRVKRFIEQHAFEDIWLDDVARCVNISPFTLLRRFKQHTGQTPGKYISAIRLERVKQLLADHRISIGEIGKRVGIRDQQYFSRWFRHATGMSPTMFRKKVIS